MVVRQKGVRSSSPPNNIIAVFWDDLVVGGSFNAGKVYYKSGVQGSLQYLAVAWEGASIFALQIQDPGLASSAPLLWRPSVTSRLTAAAPRMAPILILSSGWMAPTPPRSSPPWES